MAFGRKPSQDSTERSNASGDKKAVFFETTTIRFDLAKTGKSDLEAFRTFLFLPDLNDPTLPEAEVSAYALWLPVTIDGKTRNEKTGKEFKRRIFIDKELKDDLPEYVRKGVIYRKWMNVYDLTPVVVTGSDPDDPTRVSLAYSNGASEYTSGYGENITVHKEKATPNKRIMILEAPLALITDMEGLPTVTVDDDGNAVDFLDMKVRAVFRLDEKQNYVPKTSGQKYTGDKEFYKLPRWNVADLYKPYPANAVEDLLGGVDFNKVVEEYGIVRMPTLVGNPKVAEEEVEKLPF